MDDLIPLLCGYLFISDSKKGLLKALENPKMYHQEAVEASLARLGVSEFQKKIFKRHYQLIDSFRHEEYKGSIGSLYYMEQDVFRLTFIGTQQSLFLISDWMDTTFRYPWVSEGALGYLGAGLFPYLTNTIVNHAFVEIAKDKNSKSLLSEFTMKQEDLLRLKQWMIRNKGEYKINNRFYWGNLH